MSQIVIVSGPPGAGKSTVCEALRARYDRAVHIETDNLYRWVRMVFTQRWEAAFKQQDLLVSRAAACAATAFAREPYRVFVDGVIVAAHLPVYLEEMRSAGVAVHYAVLLPPLEVLLKRGDDRALQIPGDRGLRAMSDTIKRVHAMFADQTAAAAWTLDNSDLTPEQTADEVMQACGRGDCLIWSLD